MPIAVDGRQFIHAPELGCVAEERHASRCWSSKGLKAAEREDDLMSSLCHSIFHTKVIYQYAIIKHSRYIKTLRRLCGYFSPTKIENTAHDSVNIEILHFAVWSVYILQYKLPVVTGWLQSIFLNNFLYVKKSEPLFVQFSSMLLLGISCQQNMNNNFMKEV